MPNKALPVFRGDDVLHGHAIFCPGCGHAHVFNSRMPNKSPGWDFNGNLEKPTFTPSMRVFCPAMHGEPERTICHSWVTNGKITFLEDSTGHTLRGEHPLPDFPADYKV